MFIIFDQEQEHQYPFETRKHIKKLYARPAISFGKIWGMNLYFGKRLLGTFDTVQDILNEITAIATFQGLEYYVTQQPVWADWELLKEGMR